MRHTDEAYNNVQHWHGYFAAMATPFNADFSLDHHGVVALLQWLLAEDMNGIVVAGTTGEWTALSREERYSLFSLARHTVPATIPLLAGCSALTTAEVIGYAERAEALEMDGILVTIPPYVIPTDDEIFAYFAAIARATRLPIMIYNWPLGTGRELKDPILERLSTIDSIVALKNSTPDLRSFVTTLKSFQKRWKIFGVMPGDLGLGILQNIGGDGCIGATGVLGKVQPGFFTAAKQGDLGLARQLGAQDQRLMATLFDGFQGRFGHAVATFKHLLQLRQLPAGPVRPPLLPLSTAGAMAVRLVAQELGLV